MRPVVLPHHGRHVGTAARPYLLRDDLVERAGGPAKQDVPAVALEEAPLHTTVSRYDDEGHRPLVLEVSDMKLAVSLRQLKAKEGMRVVPSDHDAVAAAGFLACAPEELPEAG